MPRKDIPFLPGQIATIEVFLNDSYPTLHFDWRPHNDVRWKRDHHYTTLMIDNHGTTIVLETIIPLLQLIVTDAKLTHHHLMEETTVYLRKKPR